MSSLYQITNKIIEYYYNQEDFTPEDQAKIETFLNKELKKKSTGIIAVIQDKESLIEGVDQEIKRLQEYKKWLVNKTDNLKEMTKEQMTRLGIDKQETALGVLSIAKNPISVEVLDEEKVSKAFKNKKEIWSVDKKKIKEHYLETGEIVEGIKIVDDKTSLRIR